MKTLFVIIFTISSLFLIVGVMLTLGNIIKLGGVFLGLGAIIGLGNKLFEEFYENYRSKKHGK